MRVGAADAGASAILLAHGSIFSFFPFSEKKEKSFGCLFWADRISPIDPHHPHRLSMIYDTFIENDTKMVRK